MILRRTRRTRTRRTRTDHVRRTASSAGARAPARTRLLSLAAAFVTAAGLIVAFQTAAAPAAAAATCRPFPDVDASNPHCRSIDWLAGQGITKPVGGRYLPDRAVNRGSMATFLFRMANPGAAAPHCRTRPFPDVPTTSVHCGAIRWAVDHGITFGYDDGTYRPSARVTRGAMATFLYRIATGGHPIPSCAAQPFLDVAKRSVHCGSITWLSATEVTLGVGVGVRYAPGDAVTRGSMATFIKRLTDLPAYLKEDPFPPGRGVTAGLLAEINRIRAASPGRSAPLTVDPAMEKIAYCRSQEQARERRMSHDGFRAKSCGMDSYRVSGENVATDYATPAAALKGWRTSPGHYGNLTNPGFTQVAVAVVFDVAGRPYYTMLLR